MRLKFWNTKDQIIKYCKKIVNKAIKKAKATVKGPRYLKYAKVGYIRIKVFVKDFRRRRFANSGLIPELACTVGYQRLKRIKTPDITGGTVEYINNIKVVWNPKTTI